MKVDELQWHKYNYPRGKSKENDNEIKLEVENVERIKRYIDKHKKLPPSAIIRYNKRKCPCHDKYPIIDGSHSHLAVSEKGWKQIPKEHLEELDIPIEEEIIWAVAYNLPHGLLLKDEDAKAVLAVLLDDKKKLKYGTIPKLADIWDLPESTLYSWLATIRKGPTQGKSADSADSLDINISEDKEKEKLKKEVEELRIENTELKKDATQYILHQLCTVAQNHIRSCDICGK